MNGSTHTAAGLACGLTAAAFLMPETLTLPGVVMGSGAAVIASTLPDCDQYETHMNQGFQCIVKLVVFCFLVQWLTGTSVDWQYAFFFVIGIFVGAMTEHRSATHSVAALLIFTWLFSTMAGNHQELTFWFFVAYASHMVLDILNKRGEMLLWPLSKERFCLKLSKSEGKLGKLIFRVAGVWYLMLLGWVVISGSLI